MRIIIELDKEIEGFTEGDDIERATLVDEAIANAMFWLNDFEKPGLACEDHKCDTIVLDTEYPATITRMRVR